METVDRPDEPGLIFDCDGTLADTMPLHYKSWNIVLARVGIEFGEDRFYALAGQPAIFIIEKLSAEQDIKCDSKLVADEREQIFLELLPLVEPIEPIVAIARAYRDERRMGVGSGSTRASILQILKHIGMDNFFDAVVCAEDTTEPKPAPDVFLKVAEQIGVEPNQCRVYEDGDLGLDAARRAGMSCFDIRTVHSPRRVT